MASNSIKWPFQIATHARKFTSPTSSLKNKNLAGAFGFSLSNTVSQMFAHNGTSVTPVCGYFGPPVSANASAGTVALTPQQSGALCAFDLVGGGSTTFTLPTPQVGLWYQFVVLVAWASGTYKIVTNNPGTVLMIGSLWETVAAGTGTQFFPNGSSHSAINMAGTTTGGLINTAIDVYCVSPTQWLVDGVNMASGTIATPFANS